jgi:quinol monooxygenase YgiN
MTKLDPNDGHLVLINTFSVAPENAERLLAELVHATENVMCRRPGFVSANLHLSEDRKRVANYAQWRSKADLDAMMKDPEAKQHMQKAASIAISFEPIFYELRESHSAPGAPST